MLSFVICDNSIKLADEEAFTCDADIGGFPISLGLIEIPPPEFMQTAGYEHYVLVRKRAFSCNYRDINLISHFQKRCQDSSSDTVKFYSGFGSDFVAEVVNAGEKVSSLAVGDRVIPNPNYPYNEAANIRGGIFSNAASMRYEIFHESQLLALPGNISDRIAAAMSVCSITAFSMVRRLHLSGNERILITGGASNTSLAILSLLKEDYPDLSIVVLTTGIHSGEIERYGVRVISTQSFFEDPKWRNEPAYSKGFNVVIDSFTDIYLPKIIDYMSFESKYITCGIYRQSHDIHREITADCNWSELAYKIIRMNVSLIGNCLGKTSDLMEAIQKVANNELLVKIDSVYSGNSLSEFIDQTFNNRDRFGKVVYVY